LEGLTAGRFVPHGSAFETSYKEKETGTLSWGSKKKESTEVGGEREYKESKKNGGEGLRGTRALRETGEA